jgi:nucleoside-diphosphate-sugar epimerase
MIVTKAKTRHLIVGSTGLLGSALRHHLLARGIVFATVDRAPANSNTGAQQTWLLDDLTSLPKDFESIYLLAARIPWGNMDTPDAALVEANVKLPEQVAGLFPNSHLLHASSVSVYGTPLNSPITTDHPYNRPNYYAQTKLAGETVVQTHSNACILRFSSLYGIGMTPHLFLPSIIRQALTQGQIQVFGTGKRRQNYLQVERAAAMLALAAVKGLTGIHHAVAGRAFSNYEVATHIARLIPGTKITLTDRDDSPSFEYQASPQLEDDCKDEEAELANGLAALVLDQQKTMRNSAT